MKFNSAFLLLLLIMSAHAAVPTIESFEPTQFDTNALRIKYRSDWTNEVGVIRPATVNTEVTVTNLNLYETLVLPAKVVLLTLGTNELNVATNSTWLLHSPTNDATQVVLSLAAGKFQGQLLFLTSQNGDGAFTLPDESEQYDVPGALVDLQGDWVGTTNRGVILQYTAPDWIEMARFNPGSPAPEGFTTGVGVTNISNVLSGNYTAGPNITLTTNANGAVAITASTSSAANWTASGTTNSTLAGTAWANDAVLTNSVSIGAIPATTGSLRLPYQGWMTSRNLGNTSDLNLWRVTAGDYLAFDNPIQHDDLQSFPNTRGYLAIRRSYTNVATAGEHDSSIYVNLQAKQAGTVTEGRSTVISNAGDRTDVVNKTISGAANNGSGLIRITTSAAHTFSTGDKIAIYAIVGTTEANGVWLITVIDSTNFDLIGSTFSSAYISGGTATNRGLLYAVTARVYPLLDRGGLTGTAQDGDDVNAFVAYNIGPGKGTDAYYLGRNASSFPSSSEWLASFSLAANSDYGIRLNGTYVNNALDFSVGTISSGVAVHFGDSQNIQLGTGAGTKIGTATTQKLGFFNATPIIQPANTNDLRISLIDLGLLATGGATPLNLNGGSLTTVDVTSTGRIKIADGTQLQPSIVFSSDDDAGGTGFYRVGANLLGVTSNGSEVARFTTTSLLLNAVARISGESTGILQIGDDSASPAAQTVKGPDGIGSNIAGANLIIGAGRSTGTGVGGSILLQTSPAGGPGSSQNALATVLTIPSSGAISGRLPVDIGGACSDETTALTTGTNKLRFRMPHSMTLTAVRANLTTAQTAGSILTVDINEDGTSLLSTKITIDDNETTSTTAATAPVISDTALADDAIITVDIDQVGTSPAGLKVWIIGYR